MDSQLNYRRPSSVLLALELPRAGLGAITLGPTWPLLRMAPAGDGHPVLVLPGFGASDLSTRVLRGFLRDRGYHVHAWRLGRNLGPSRATVEGLRERVRQLAERHQQEISVVGWSLGGIYAREIAIGAPAVIRQVITLGSPLRLRDIGASHAGLLFDRAQAGRGRLYDQRPPEEQRGPLPVPATSVFTRSDGVVPWDSCLEVPSATSESVEVLGSHSGLGHNPAVLWVVADRLAQPPGTWAPFRARGAARALFPPRRSSTS